MAVLIAGAALLIGCGTASVPEEAKRRPPNIVFILIDDLGWSDLPSYGNAFCGTPNIDRLARQGVRFTDFYAAGAVCSPTRAGIMSGQYQARFGITDFIPGHWRPFEKLVVPEVTRNLPAALTTMAEALHDAGYATGHFGKWHLGGQGSQPPDHGFTTAVTTGGRHFAPRFRTTPKMDVPDGTYLADFLTDRALEFIDRNRSRRFFIHLSHYAVHIPLEAKAGTIKKYEKKPKPAKGINHPVYAAMIEHVDESVGRVLAKLKALGLEDDTVVVFTSDNGGLRQRYTADGDIVTTNAPLRDEKGSIYEGGIRVPLIVRYPGMTPHGTTCAEPTISVDFYPTFLELAGSDGDSGHVLDGLSLVPLLKDPTSRLDRDAIYFHYPHYHHSRPAGAIRARNWKLIEFFEDGALELYDLEDDIGERRNRSGEEAGRADELRRRLAAWRESVGAAMPAANPKHDASRAAEWWSRRTKQPLKRR